MQLLPHKYHVDFMKQRRLALVISALLMLISVTSLSIRGLEFGIDFTGGTLIEVGYAETVELEPIRMALANAGFDTVVQHFGTSHDVLMRIASHTDTDKSRLSTAVLHELEGIYPIEFQLRRVEFVGPQVGDELTEQGGLALLFALLGIFIYVLLRFEWKFSVGSVMALFHDALITLGIFSVLGLEFDLPVLAAMLAVIGYSLNDTIVVFDRVRENFRKMRKQQPIEIINRSLNQTLSRTLMTSMTTLLVLSALFLLGGELIHGFAIALIIGVLIGTYSSIYIASTSVLLFGIQKSDMMAVRREDPTTNNPL